MRYSCFLPIIVFAGVVRVLEFPDHKILRYHYFLIKIFCLSIAKFHAFEPYLFFLYKKNTCILNGTPGKLTVLVQKTIFFQIRGGIW